MHFKFYIELSISKHTIEQKRFHICINILKKKYINILTLHNRLYNKLVVLVENMMVVDLMATNIHNISNMNHAKNIHQLRGNIDRILVRHMMHMIEAPSVNTKNNKKRNKFNFKNPIYKFKSLVFENPLRKN